MSHHEGGLYDRVTVDNRCSECGAPINIRVGQHLSTILAETKEAVCAECDPKSKWKRQRRCEICDCFEGEHSVEFREGVRYLVCKNCGECGGEMAEGAK